MHAYIVNNQVVEYPIINLRQRLPEISLPVDLTKDELLPAGFVYVHPIPEPEYNPDTHRLQLILPICVDGKWQDEYEVVPLTAEEIKIVVENKSLTVRAERNQRLAESDWTQGKDIPDSISLPWASYRQAVRDVTLQPNFPFDIQWPEKPV